MPVETKGDYDEDKPSNPRIMQDYYIAEFNEVVDYERDDARGLVLKFRIDREHHPDVTVENDFDLERSDGEIVLPFFAPAKLSVSEDAQSSRLSENLMSLGLHDTVLEMLNDEVSDLPSEFSSLKEAVNSGKVKYSAKSESEADAFRDVLNGVLKGKRIRVDVSEDDERDESQVAELDRVFESDSGSGDSSEGKDKLFDGEDEGGGDEGGKEE